MNPKTHLYIADRVVEQLRGDNINLNNSAFKLGSVIPDFSPYHKIRKHYMDKSLIFIENSIEGLNYCKDINEASFKIGIISHYLADYFCYPHYNNMTFTSKDVVTHIKYEVELDKHLSKYNNEFIKKYNFKNFNDLIEAILNLYKNNKTFKDDLDSSLLIVNNLIFNLNKWNKLFAI